MVALTSSLRATSLKLSRGTLLLFLERCQLVLTLAAGSVEQSAFDLRVSLIIRSLLSSADAALGSAS